MAISDERFSELVEYYNQIKEAVIRVDNKYSVDYVEPQIDFPPTLGLEPLQFTPKTDEELQSLAHSQVEPEFISKRAREKESLDKQTESIRIKQTEQNAAHQKVLEKLLADYNTETAKLHYKLVNHGLLYSTVNTKASNEQRENYTNSVHSATAEHEDKLEALSQQLNVLNSIYQYTLEQLDAEQEAKEYKLYLKLVDQQNKQQQSVDKYNQTLEEKEIKYKASCERSLQYARQAEYERALEASRLYAELGESGIKQMMLAEKLTVAKVYFTPLSLEEAHCIMDMDGFLVTHLGTNYSAFEDWVNVTLR